MKRSLLNLATLLSLLLCVAIGIVRVRHYLSGDSRLTIGESADGTFVALFGPRDIRVMIVESPDRAQADSTMPPRAGTARTVLDLPLYLLATLGAALPALRLNRWIHRVSVHSGHCLSCGYDLTGNVSGVCPECGDARMHTVRGDP